ncbi:hypothetical protein N431DRAFT_506103 [Stipitochalara longipes BDJ]|nr:hypothetical protein N431DRAFT_506103 [Stipitochalara longipes BDJ]
MSFSFSVGDFISALEVVATVVDALRATSKAATQYQGLLKQLDSLQAVLLAVKSLRVDESLIPFESALQQAASQCLCTVADFWKTLQKYQPYLGTVRQGHGLSLKAAVMNIRWSLCRSDDISKFQVDLMGHTQAIQILIAVVNQNLNDQYRNLKTFSGLVQQAHNTHMQSLATISKQGEEVLERTNKIISNDVRVCQIVLQYQDAVTEIPGQIDHQQPVFIIDSLNRIIPFYLEYIQSYEAFKSMLKANFQHIGNACKRIDRGSFVLQDKTSLVEIDFNAHWSQSFRPGQRINMRMVAWDFRGPTLCPECKILCVNKINYGLHW